MERDTPDYEDERLRYWRAREEEAHRWDADPTVMDVDQATEEVYESRIYRVTPEALARLTAETAMQHPEVPLTEIAAMYLEGVEDAAFRVMAKRRKADGRLTFIMVGVLAGRRELMAREDLIEEPRFREFVQSFEQDALANGVVEEPAVIDIEGWRHYGNQQGGPAPAA